MTRRAWWSLAAATAAAALGLSLGHAYRADPPAERAAGPVTVERDERAPRLAGRTLTGDRFDLAELRGSTVLVNAWASWCAPCREELPLLAAAQRRWSGDGLRVVGLAVRDDDGRARMLLADVGATDLTVVPDPRGAIAVSWGVHALPETFLVDRHGRVRAWVRGPVTRQWLEERVRPLLAL